VATPRPRPRGTGSAAKPVEPRPPPALPALRPETVLSLLLLQLLLELLLELLLQLRLLLCDSPSSESCRELAETSDSSKLLPKLCTSSRKGCGFRNDYCRY